MSQRRLPIGRISALIAVAVGLFVVFRGAHEPRWRTLRPGVEFATIRGEPYCRRGSAQIALLRLDPARVRLRIHHFRADGFREPPNIVEWWRRTSALAVFNAGQYYPDWSYMGLLVARGRALSSRLHRGFKAALVADPDDGGRDARVIDLDAHPLDPRSPGWREIAQSFMLFDSSGTIRVRHSNNVANRTAVGEDRDGRLLVATSEGGYTLWDFAKVLEERPLGLKHAMSMDGGAEAELAVAARGFRYASFGHWDAEGGGESSPGATTALPAVITVSAP